MKPRLLTAVYAHICFLDKRAKTAKTAKTLSVRQDWIPYLRCTLFSLHKRIVVVSADPTNTRCRDLLAQGSNLYCRLNIFKTDERVDSMNHVCFSQLLVHCRSSK